MRDLLNISQCEQCIGATYCENETNDGKIHKAIINRKKGLKNIIEASEMNILMKVEFLMDNVRLLKHDNNGLKEEKE